MLVTRFVRFALVGGLATGIQYGLLILLVKIAGVEPVPASALGFAISAIANYLINYRYTFRSTVRHAAALMKFSALAGVGLAVNSAIMSQLLKLGAHYLIAQIVATGVVLLWNFAGNHWWTFRIKAEPETPLSVRRRRWFVPMAAGDAVWLLFFVASVEVLAFWVAAGPRSSEFASDLAGAVAGYLAGIHL